MTDLETSMKHFSMRLEKLQQALQLMKQFGVNEDLLLAYLCHNLKIGEAKARDIMECYEKFYSGFIKEGMLKKLEEKK